MESKQKEIKKEDKKHLPKSKERTRSRDKVSKKLNKPQKDSINSENSKSSSNSESEDNMNNSNSDLENQYNFYKKEQLESWLSRPAKVQVEDSRKNAAYTEGHYDYNIWYGKYLTDRKEEKERLPAEYKCCPEVDTGFTKADKNSKKFSFFCLYFARGCCCEGKNCKFYHHVPTLDECEKIENSKDIFGRSRFSSALTDNGGIGIFTKNCRVLFVCEMKKIQTKNSLEDMVKIIYESFSQFGDVEDIKYNIIKNNCYVVFKHRCFAEFAKEAMMRQSLVDNEVINITWAYDFEE